MPSHRNKASRSQVNLASLFVLIALVGQWIEAARVGPDVVLMVSAFWAFAFWMTVRRGRWLSALVIVAAIIYMPFGLRAEREAVIERDRNRRISEIPSSRVYIIQAVSQGTR